MVKNKNALIQLKGRLLLFIIGWVVSCQGQDNSNSNNPPPETSSFVSASKTEEWTAPRTDSIFQFNSRIGILLEDSKGNLWIVSHNDGVCRYDGTQFTYFTKEQGLASVRAIHEAINGDIWFGIEEGVQIFDGQNIRTIRLPKASVMVGNQPTLITESSQSFQANFEEEWAKERANFWFSAFNKNGVYRFDGNQLSHITLPVPEDYPEFDESGYHPDHGYDRYAVYGIYKDNENKIWFGTAGAGLHRYDGKSIQFINEKDTIGVVRAIYQDGKGNIWYGNNAIGVYQYDGEKTMNFSQLKAVDTEGLDGALSITEDEDGNIWFGTFDSGLWRYNPNADTGGQTPLKVGVKSLVQYTSKDGLGSNYISTVFKDSKGQLWIGTGKGDIFKFNGKGFDRLSKLK